MGQQVDMTQGNRCQNIAHTERAARVIENGEPSILISLEGLTGLESAIERERLRSVNRILSMCFIEPSCCHWAMILNVTRDGSEL